MFPDRLPGAGLLLLRTAVGAALLVQGDAYFADWHNLPLLNVAVALLTIAIGIALLVGYLTPVVAILAGLIIVGGTFSWFPVPYLDLFEGRMTAAFATAIAAALVCVGPGAFSLDARLFGRREIVIPSSTSRES